MRYLRAVPMSATRDCPGNPALPGCAQLPHPAQPPQRGMTKFHQKEK
jgi:hypothetical protein